MSTPENVARILARLQGVKKSGDEWSAKCPAHDDKRASLSVGVGREGQVLLKCFAGCETTDVVNRIGLELRDLFPATPNSHPSGHTPPSVVTAYEYTDESGTPLYESVRMYPKDFRQRRPDGSGGWIWSVKGVRRVPYRLPAVLKAVRDGRTIFVVEGEKDVQRLELEGFVATTNVGGANKWSEELCEPFSGARVVVIPDNDDPGRRHAFDVAGKLSRVSSSVSLLELPQLPDKGDVSDWFEAGGTADRLKQLVKETAQPWDRFADPVGSTAETPRRLPPPMTVRELMDLKAPAEKWIAEGLIPGEANILMAAYPKSYKTFACLEIGVSAVTGSRLMGKFRVPKRCNVGMILMEGSAYRTRVRLERICEGKGHTLDDLEGGFFMWFRPPLKLSSASDMKELSEYAKDCELDLLMIDNWSYVSTGSSDKSDEVTPQLDALSRLRESRPGMSALMVHHARKTSPDTTGERLTDIIRNSTAFGAWYDVGMVLSRKNETSPVTVRTEMRDHASPEPFAFTVEDEFPAGPESGRTYSSGWLKLVASDRSPAVVEQEAAVKSLMGIVSAYLEANQGCSKNQLGIGIAGDRNRVVAAFDALCSEGYARQQNPEKSGGAARCWLNYRYPGRERIEKLVSGRNRGGIEDLARKTDEPSPGQGYIPKGGYPGGTGSDASADPNSNQEPGFWGNSE